MLLNDLKADSIDRLLAISNIHQAIAEMLMPDATVDLKLTEQGRDGLAHLHALLCDALMDTVEKIGEEKRKEGKE